jgi:periplasmic protein CpxP/Spy
MKKIILVALLMIGTIIVAQERNKRQQGDEKMQFTPEQKSQLMLKKMTLELDLNDSQQKEFKTIIAEKMTKMEEQKAAMKTMKEKGVRPTSDELFAMASKKLDEQIANKKRMEKILNPKQYEKWTAMNEKHHEDRKGNFRGPHKGNKKGNRPGGFHKIQQDNPERKG